MEAPIYSIVGYRSYLNQGTLRGDISLVFTKPILAAWQLDVRAGPKSPGPAAARAQALKAALTR